MRPASRLAPLIDGDDSTAHKVSLRAARPSIYLYQFVGSASWGIYNVIFSYFLTRDGNLSTVQVAFTGTFSWAGYAIFQFCLNPLIGAISDRIGRRPVLISCITAVTLCFFAYAWPVQGWWIVVGSIQGGLDGTWAMCNAIAVDCIVSGVPPGDETDIAIARLLRYLTELSPSDDGEKVESEMRHSLTVGMSIVWMVGGLGNIFGFGLATLLYYFSTTTSFFSLALCQSMAGVILIPVIFYLYQALPETKPPSALDKNDDFGEVLKESLRAQAAGFQIITRDWRACCFLTAYLCTYMVLTATFALGLFWGRALHGWGVAQTAGFFLTCSVSPALGLFTANKFLYPSLGFSRGMAVLILFSSLAFSLVNSADGSYALTLFVISLATAGLGIYPTLTGLLTPEVSHKIQGQLQGMLYAVSTLGSLFSLFLFYLFFTMVSYRSIWYLCSFFMSIASLALFAGGGGDPKNEALRGALVSNDPLVKNDLGTTENPLSSSTSESSL